MESSALPADPLSGRDLAAFVAAVDAGSVQGGADALSLTQSAATKRLQALERRLGTPLLHRTRTGVRLTEAGRTLYPEARQALAALVRAEAAVTGPATGRRVLRLAASHTIGEVLLPAWLAASRLAEPDVQVQVEIVNSPGVLRRVRDGDAQVGFVEGLDRLTGLEARTLARDEIVAVVAAGHRWARRAAVRAAELRSEPYLTREPGSGTRAVAEAGLLRAGVTLQPALEAASLQSLKRALATGGFTLISALTVVDERRAGTLHALPVSGTDLRRELRAVRMRRDAHEPAAAAFWRWLVREVARG